MSKSLSIFFGFFVSLFLGCHHTHTIYIASSPSSFSSSSLSLTGKNFWVERVDYQPAANLKYSPETLSALAIEFTSCGSTMSGPTCLDTQFSTSNYLFTENSLKVDHGKIYLSAVLSKSGKNEFAFVLATEVLENKRTESENEGIVTKASLYAISEKEAHDLESIKNSYLLHRLEKVADLILPSDPIAFASNALPQENDIKRLVHLTQYLINHDSKRAYYSQIKSILSAKSQLFAQSKNVLYQRAILEILRDSFSKETDILISISEKLLLVTDQDVSELAAITLGEQSVKTKEVKVKIKEALKNLNWEYRKLAVLALDQIKEGLEDEKSLIERIGDTSSSVREAAAKVVASFPLTVNHLGVFQDLLQNSDYSIRRMAVQFVGKIRDAKAVHLLIPMLGDSAGSVQQEAWTSLSSVSFTNEYIADASKLLKSNDYSVRLLGVQLLGKIKTPLATEVLIPMLGDSAGSVQTQAYQELQKSPLSEKDIPALKKLLTSADYSTRMLGVGFLGKIQSPAAALAIIPMLGDSAGSVQTEAFQNLKHYSLLDQHIPALQSLCSSSDYSTRLLAVQFLGNMPIEKATEVLIPMLSDNAGSVQAEAANQLAKRSLSEGQISALRKVLGSTDYSARLLAAQFLGKIKASQSTAVLISALCDNAGSVAQQIVTSLEMRPFTEDHVTLLGQQLQNSDYSCRVAAAQFLGSTSSKKALDLLIDRLTKEDAGSVEAQIKQSIQQVKGRLN